MRKWTRWVCLFTLLIFGTGCLPQEGVVWLPDSSGLIVVSSDYHSVIHYDIARRAWRKVLTDMNAKILRAAVSPDGKRLAYGRLIGKDKGSTLQVCIHALSGTKDKQSSIFLHSGSDSQLRKDEKEQITTSCFWSSDGQHILLQDATSRALSMYDVNKDKLLCLKPAMVLPIQGSPILPNGKGFLAVRGGHNVAELLCIDWDGWEQSVRIATKHKEDAIFLILFSVTSLGTTSWKQGQAQIGLGSVTLARIDTDPLSVAWPYGVFPETKDLPDNLSLFEHRFVDGGLIMRTFSVDKDKFTFRCELCKDGSKRKELIATSPCLIFPAVAPDRRHVALLVQSLDEKDLKKQEPTRRVLIIDTNGEIVDTIEL